MVVGGLAVEVAGGNEVVEGGSKGDFVVVSRFCFGDFVSKAWKGMVEVEGGRWEVGGGRWEVLMLGGAIGGGGQVSIPLSWWMLWYLFTSKVWPEIAKVLGVMEWIWSATQLVLKNEKPSLARVFNIDCMLYGGRSG